MKEFQKKIKTVVKRHAPDKEQIRRTVKGEVSIVVASPKAERSFSVGSLAAVAVTFILFVGIVVGSVLVEQTRKPAESGVGSSDNETESSIKENPELCGFDKIFEVFSDALYQPMEGGMTGDELCERIRDGRIQYDDVCIPMDFYLYDRMWPSIDPSNLALENVTSKAFYEKTGCQLFNSQNAGSFILIDTELVNLFNGSVFPSEQIVVRGNGCNGFVYCSTLPTGMFYGFVNYFDFETRQGRCLLATQVVGNRFGIVDMEDHYDYALCIHEGSKQGDLMFDVLARAVTNETQPWSVTHHLFYEGYDMSLTNVEVEPYEPRDLFDNGKVATVTITAEPVSKESMVIMNADDLLSMIEAYPTQKCPMFFVGNGLYGGEPNYKLTISYHDGSKQSISLAPGYMYTDDEIYRVDTELYERFCDFLGNDHIFKPMPSAFRIVYGSKQDLKCDIKDEETVEELYRLIAGIEGTKGEAREGPLDILYSITLFTTDDHTTTITILSGNEYCLYGVQDDSGLPYIFSADLSELYAYLAERLPH